ncbi:MAG: dihydrofolate reductase [Marinobacterium sp.]|nr:dihydrofolate reductase [Marinobacterium sp.]
MKLAIIVAQAQNRTIGINNKLPWRLPEDMKYFKHVTMGKPIIMGRKTFDSIKRPLPGRTNIVITRDQNWQHDGVRVVHSLSDACELAESICLIEGQHEAMVIGGSEIYNQALADCDRLYLTQVYADIAGDAYFPAFDKTQWQELGRQDFQADGCNPYDYSFIVLDRKTDVEDRL